LIPIDRASSLTEIVRSIRITRLCAAGVVGAARCCGGAAGEVRRCGAVLTGLLRAGGGAAAITARAPPP
jgi:hypothetical protein